MTADQASVQSLHPFDKQSLLESRLDMCSCVTENTASNADEEARGDVDVDADAKLDRMGTHTKSHR